jgi:hypothetical protein
MSFGGPHPDIDIPDSSLYQFLSAGMHTDDLDGPALADAPSGCTTTYRSRARGLPRPLTTGGATSSAV